MRMSVVLYFFIKEFISVSFRMNRTFKLKELVEVDNSVLAGFDLRERVQLA